MHTNIQACLFSSESTLNKVLRIKICLSTILATVLNSLDVTARLSPIQKLTASGSFPEIRLAKFIL